MRFETRAIHEGQDPDALTGSVAVPVYQTSTYRQAAVGIHKGYEYSRTGNPTRNALETALASVENGRYALAFASGVAATSAVFHLLKKGDHVVAGDDLYGGTYRLLERVFKRWGLTASYADAASVPALEKAITKKTRLIWIETPTNPLLKIADIGRLAALARKKKIMLAVDNTFASPWLQNPLDLGADIVVHSTTKYIAGHSDVIGGAVVTNDTKLFENMKFWQNAAGAVPGPWDSWLVLRGLKTLGIRMKEHDRNARILAAWLVRQPGIRSVLYPGLKSHPHHATAVKQMRGFGGMISLELDGGRSSVDAFFSALRIFTLGESLGGVESLVSYPAAMTHASLPAVERRKRGITDGLIRLSVGIEHVSDLKNDLKRALKKI